MQKTITGIFPIIALTPAILQGEHPKMQKNYNWGFPRYSFDTQNVAGGTPKKKKKKTKEKKKNKKI